MSEWNTTAGGGAEPAVELIDLSVRFGDYQALDSLSLRLPQAMFLAILGPNGAGKSTLLKALMGLVDPTAGTVRVLGRSPRLLPPSWIGYVPQIKTLERSFPAVALELVLTGLLGRWPGKVAPADRARAIAAMKHTTTEHLAMRPIGHLSGGELQRVYLARGLVRRPRLILLDEPASGMDARGEADMYDRLEDYREETGASVVMITHDWQVARHHADYVLVMDRRVVGFGPPEESLSEDNLRKAFGHVGHRHPPRRRRRGESLAPKLPDSSDSPGDSPGPLDNEGGPETGAHGHSHESGDERDHDHPQHDHAHDDHTHDEEDRANHA